jgi:ABC-2 type transport system permease protein
MIHRILALFRAAVLNASSYRLGGLMSIGTLLVQFAPAYYVGHTLQPFVGSAISNDGGEFFGFLVFGLVGVILMRAGVESLPRAIETGLSTGTLEALISTPVGLPALVIGLTLYDVLWALINVCVMLALGALLGLHYAWGHLPLALLLLVSITVSYFGFGMIAAALGLWVRRSSTLRTGVMIASIFLGGVTYPLAMIPARFRVFSAFVPVTYSLRAVRRLLLQDAPVAAVAPDIAVALVTLVGVLALGSLALRAALMQSRRTGTLTQY